MKVEEFIRVASDILGKCSPEDEVLVWRGGIIALKKVVDSNKTTIKYRYTLGQVSSVENAIEIEQSEFACKRCGCFEVHHGCGLKNVCEHYEPRGHQWKW
jgi:hypothetical protein